MKKIILILIVISSFFMFNDKVKAAISSQNTEIECVYANGMAILLRPSTSYNSEGVKTVTPKVYLNKNKSVAVLADIELNASVNDELYSPDSVKVNLEKLQCPTYLRYYLTKMVGEDDIMRGLYYIGRIPDTKLYGTIKTSWHSWLTGYANPTYEVLKPALKNNDSYSSLAKVLYYRTKIEELDPDEEIAIYYINYSLVSERLSFVGALESGDYAQVFKVYSEDTQAINDNKFAQFYTNDSGKRWLQIGKTITSVATNVDISGNDKIICILESAGIQDPSKSEGGFVFNSSKHIITELDSNGNCKSSDYVKYIKTTRVCEAVPGNPNGSFCEKYPESAKQLAKVINIMQVLVPAIVIVFTGIDIGKIVIAGNIEEELPKKKKSIIIRLIIMIVFFFLPIIVKLIISLAEGVPISDVDCLFTDGVTTTDGSSLECYDESEDLNEE